MSEPTVTAARLAGVHDAIAEALPSGGFLRCNVCHRREDVGDVAGNLRHGWPKCCGLTMTWWTPRQIAAGQARFDVKPLPCLSTVTHANAKPDERDTMGVDISRDVPRLVAWSGLTEPQVKRAIEAWPDHPQPINECPFCLLDESH